jgi:hypothetical protein
MNTTRSKYEIWLMNRFEGETPKNSILNAIESILINANQKELPIDLAGVAKSLGINHMPLYGQSQFSDCCLKEHKGELRISFKIHLSDINNSKKQSSRFSYAHELIHCLGYDFDNKMAVRHAPKPRGLEEEKLCNFGAANLILPEKILKNIGEKLNGNILNKIVQLSILSKTSIINVFNQLKDIDFLLPSPNTIYLISGKSKGYQKRNEIKYRCISSVYYDDQNRNTIFLPSSKGLDSVINGQGSDWSLINFHKKNRNYYKDSIEVVKNENIKVKFKGEKEYFLSEGQHTRINEVKNFVWTELKAKMDC